MIACMERMAAAPIPPVYSGHLFYFICASLRIQGFNRRDTTLNPLHYAPDIVRYVRNIFSGFLETYYGFSRILAFGRLHLAYTFYFFPHFYLLFQITFLSTKRHRPVSLCPHPSVAACPELPRPSLSRALSRFSSSSIPLSMLSRLKSSPRYLREAIGTCGVAIMNV